MGTVTSVPKVAPALKLPWEECKCGCDGYAASIGPLHVWIDNLNDKLYNLHVGHSWHSPKLGTYRSFNEADEAAVAHLRPKFHILKEEMEKFASLFS